MSTKTLTLSAYKTAQGTVAISKVSYGYTSSSFVTGAAEYANLSHPVAMQFDPLPSAMEPFIPTGRSVSATIKLLSAISSSYTDVEVDLYQPTTAAAQAALVDRFVDDWGVVIYSAKQKNDLDNGVFSCEYSGGWSVSPTPTVSGMQIYTKTRPYSPTGVVYCVSGTCSLAAGTYTVSKALSGKPEINGVAFWNNDNKWSIVSNSGTLSVEYNALSVVTYCDEPGGYVDRTAQTVFSWHSTWTGFPIETATQTSASLQWKDGTNGTVHSISISGSATSYTMAANTLPSSSDLYWRVTATTTSGSATSDWTSFRTTDTEGVCTGISPSGVYIDGTEETRFVWSWSNETGTAPTGYDLQVKGPADVDFSTLKSETTANTFAVVTANALPGGQIQWRVRGYNQSGVAGSWSDPLSCVVISAPAKPSVWTEDASPRPTVAWTSTGQLGFRVLIPGVYDSGTVFGTARSYKIPQYLDNDIYEIRVYILGEYDLWSKYGWNYATILNSGTGSCTLTAQAEDGDAVLSWTAVENALGYQILRGEKTIAETASTEYVDRYAIGDVSYRVRAILASDAYVMSNTAAVTLRVRSPRITALDGNWIELDMYTSPLPTTQITATRDVALMTYAGRDYPVAEVSPHRTRTWVAYPAFRDPAQAAAFEQLLGRPVFVKDQYGTSMTGIMSSVQRGAQTIYTSMTAVVQEIGGYDL